MQKAAPFRIITNEVRLKNNNVPAGKFAIAPRFTRKIGRLNENNFFLELNVEIASTEEKKTPLDLFISITGIFNLALFPENERDAYIKEEALRILFPYLRTMVTNMTAGALMPPLVLPITDLSKTFGDKL